MLVALTGAGVWVGLGFAVDSIDAVSADFSGQDWLDWEGWLVGGGIVIGSLCVGLSLISRVIQKGSMEGKHDI